MDKLLTTLAVTYIASLRLQVTAQITTADGCYSQYLNTQYLCAFPFERRTGVSEQECLQLCTDFQPQCKSVQYRTKEQICDLFQSTGSTGGGGYYGNTQTNTVSAYNTNAQSQPAPAGYLRTSLPGSATVTYVRINRRKRHSQGGGTRRFQGGFSSEGNDRRRRHGGGGGGGSRGGGGYYARLPGPPRPSLPQTGGGGGSSCGAPRTSSCPGVNYYTQTGTCGGGGGGSTSGPVPSEATCPAGQEVRFLQIDGVSLRGNNDKTFSANSPDACYQACADNKLPSGETAPCRSVDYDLGSRECSITLEVFPPAGTGVPDENPNSVYYEKVCVDAATARNCPGPYLRAPQRILVGFAENVIDVSSFSECLNACIDAQTQFGFNCISGMYFFDEPSLNCVLNTESAQTQPDLFVPEDIDAVDYFETNCLGRVSIRQRDPISGDQSDSVLPLDGQSQTFGPWTPCDQRDKRQYRFRKCKSMNPNKCTKQERRCSKTEESIRRREREKDGKISTNLSDMECPSGKCCAMMTSDGSKNCQRGVRIVQRRNKVLGRIPCSTPINC